MTMTEQEETALAFIQFHIEAFGYPPSVEEIGVELGLQKSRTHGILQKMKRDGLIQTTPGVARSWVPTGTVMKAPEETM
jgi:SOS-response transcriptional repressor LexA